jgi:polar amino acid transport system substrate-binding protein
MTRSSFVVIHHAIISFISASIILFTLATPCRADPKITACGHHDYAPWNWNSGNAIIGACAEITHELFKRVGVETELNFVGPWQRCQALIEQGIVDVNICSFVNDKRKDYSQFIMTPMGFNENSVFVRKDKVFQLESWDDLAGKKTAMVLGVSIGQEFDAFLNSKTDVVRVSTFFQSFHMLARGRIDFIPVGRYSGLAMRNSFGLEDEIVDLKKPLLSGSLYISMSKKSPYLHLLPAIEKMMQEDDYYKWVDELLQKYTELYAEEYKLNHSGEQFKPY